MSGSSGDGSSGTLGDRRGPPTRARRPCRARAPSSPGGGSGARSCGGAGGLRRLARARRPAARGTGARRPTTPPPRPGVTARGLPRSSAAVATGAAAAGAGGGRDLLGEDALDPDVEPERLPHRPGDDVGVGAVAERGRERRVVERDPQRRRVELGHLRVARVDERPRDAAQALDGLEHLGPAAPEHLGVGAAGRAARAPGGDGAGRRSAGADGRRRRARASARGRRSAARRVDGARTSDGGLSSSALGAGAAARRRRRSAGARRRRPLRGRGSRASAGAGSRLRAPARQRRGAGAGGDGAGAGAGAAATGAGAAAAAGAAGGRHAAPDAAAVGGQPALQPVEPRTDARSGCPRRPAAAAGP